MKTRLIFFFALLACNCLAADSVLRDSVLKSKPAGIKVINMAPTALVASDNPKGWAKIPSEFAKYSVTIFMPKRETNGIADITVTEDGYLLIACNYDYQGNKEGDWQKDVWDAAKFKSKGWHQLSKEELGSELIKGDNRAQLIFCKTVKKGDTLKLRANKYDPPYPILIEPMKTPAAAKAKS
ncbi:MAG: hypothetical protein WCL04_00835 [Verrucomicrobiota bacterium]